MNISEFRRLQRQGSEQTLFELVMACRRKFLDAASLLEVRSSSLEKLSAFGYDTRVDLQPIRGPFTILSERYIDQFFSQQLLLFPTPADQQDAKWYRYFYHALKPNLLANDDVVRNILRAVEAIPSQKPEHAVAALIQHFTEMPMPDTELVPQ